MAKARVYKTKKHLNKNVYYLGCLKYQEIIVMFLIIALFALQLGLIYGSLIFIPITIYASFKRKRIKQGREDITRDLIARVSYKDSFEDKKQVFKYLIKKHE